MVIIILTLGVLTLAYLGVILTLSALRLWQSPPVLHINLSGLQIPDRLALTLTHQPSDVELKPAEEPIPEDILEYISQESETHAQDARKRRVRALRVDTGSWQAAFRLLQREDNAIDG